MSVPYESAAIAPTPARPLWRTFFAFLAPMVLSNILQSMSGTLNSIYIGQMIGTRALAAVAGIFPIVFFFISLIIGVGAGASVLIGQAWGAHDTSKVKSIAGTALALGLVIGLLVAVFGGAFTHAMLTALHTPADILPNALSYARVMLLAMPGLLVFILLTQLMRGVGDTLTPLFALLISTSVGLVLTPALIRGWGGLPQMGVTSAAIASIASFIVALSFLAWYMRRKNHALAPDMELFRALKVDRVILMKVLKIGLPTGVQMIVISLAEIVLLSLVNHYGSDATAAYGAVNQVVNYVQFPALSIAITASILGAQAIGAGKIDRLGAIARTGLQMNLVLTGSLVLIAYLFSRQFISVFITSGKVVDIAQALLHIMLWSSVVFGFSAVLSGVMRASGSVLVPTGISIFCIVAVEVPAAYLLSAHFGLDGVWMAYPVTFLAMLALQTAYFQLVWKHRKIERLV
jgi:putative MATE family efflux protein